MTTTEIVEALQTEIAALTAEHAKTTKVARARAKSLSLVIKKLAVEFKKSAAEEDKAK
jgi:hypothetical protein